MRKKAAESTSRRLFYPLPARLNRCACSRNRGFVRLPARRDGHTRHCFRHYCALRTRHTRLTHKTHSMPWARRSDCRNSYFPTIRRSRRCGIRNRTRRYRPLPPHNSCATASRNCGRSKAHALRFPHHNDTPAGIPPDRLRPYNSNGCNRCYNRYNSCNNFSDSTPRYRKTRKENRNNTYTTSSFVELQKPPSTHNGTSLLLYIMQEP